jgi:type I restriction enzyme S subunit
VSDIVALTRTEVNITPDADYRVIGMRSFGRGIIRYPPTRGDELSKLRYFGFPENALALSNIKAWEGAIGVTSEREVGYLASNRSLFYLPVDARSNTSYLRHYFLSRPGRAQVAAKSPGDADRNRTLGIKGFEGIEIPLPPRSVQDHVAATLDLLSVRLVTAYEQRCLDALRPALLNAAFSGGL